MTTETNWDLVHEYLIEMGMSRVEVRNGRVYQLQDIGDVETLAAEAKAWREMTDIFYRPLA